jgi:hypothetical protein
MALVVPSRVVPDCIAQLAKHIADHSAHGYSQPNRNGDGTIETVTLRTSAGTYKVAIHGGDYDCSSMVTQILVALGILKSGTHMWTGNEDDILTANGFTRMGYSASKVRRGDILLVTGHTGVALGDGMQADAHGDEVGGLTGPTKGDQTGHEIEVRSLRSWTYIYRWSEAGGSVIDASFRVTALTERNVRNEPSTAKQSSVTGILKAGESVTCHGFVQGGKYIWGVYTNYSGATRYIALTEGVLVS